MVAFASFQFKNGLETVSNFVCHATFFEIILLHERFSINLFHDSMNKFFKEYLKVASERVSLLVDCKRIYLAKQVR